MAIGRLWGGFVLTQLVAGCYLLQPAATAGPELGTVVAMEVNDLGRLQLGGTMGPEILQVEGRLVSSQAEEYEVAVSNVRLIRGGDQIWSGERVRIRKDYVSRLYERRLSKGRSVVLGATFVAAVTVFVWKNRGLLGLGQDEGEGEPPGTAIAVRIPRP